jgi:hypothetical protein
MWICPKCGATVDAGFDVCWSCGTSREGVEDPTFVHADDGAPIEDPALDLDRKEPPGAEDELPGPPVDLVVCYETPDLMEAKFLVDQLVGEGILAVLQGTHFAAQYNLPTLDQVRVVVRADDAHRAEKWLAGFENRKARRASLE